MWRGFWIVVACGVLGFTISLGIAQDGANNGDKTGESGKQSFEALGGADGVPNFPNRGQKSSAGESAGSLPFLRKSAQKQTISAQRQQRSAPESPSRYRRGSSSKPKKLPLDVQKPQTASPDVSDAKKLPFRRIPIENDSSQAEKTPAPQSPSGPNGSGKVVSAAHQQKASAEENSLRHASRQTEQPRFSSLDDSSRPADASKPATVELKWIKQGAMNVGQPSRCTLLVRNTGQGVARDVSVETNFTPSVRLSKVEPSPKTKQERLQWHFAQLAPGEEKRIQLTLIPAQRGELTTDAIVRYSSSASGTFTIHEPKLKLAMDGPKKVPVGDPASQTIIVSNDGTGLIDNVTLEARIPKGLEHPRGERLMMDIGSLSPGESRQVRLALAAVAGGQQTVHIEARGAGGLRKVADVPVRVMAPHLKLDLQGPQMRYKGRKAVYQLQVTNDGNAPANNVRARHKLPEGFQFVQAGSGGQFDSSQQMVNWFLGQLKPGESATLAVRLKATSLGKHVHRVGVMSPQAGTAETQAETRVDGIPSPVLNIVELDDPVEVGTKTSYEIRVRNEGTKAASNIKVACRLPAAVKQLQVDGPTKLASRNDRLVFEPLKRLAAGETVTYRLTVQGTQPGSHRLRAWLSSQSIEEPLIFEELTRFYGQ